MEDTSTVCCMCGDVGFPDRLFQCTRCSSRFQHAYCSNSYSEEPSQSGTAGRVCDWCLSEGRRGLRQGTNPKKAAGKDQAKPSSKQEYSTSDGIKQTSVDQEEDGSRAKGSTSSSSAKPASRRYKLLKDVLC